MTTPNISLLIHGIIAIAVIAASTVLAIVLKQIPADVVGLFGVILGVSGVNGSNAVRAVTDDRMQQAQPPMRGGTIQ